MSIRKNNIADFWPDLRFSARMPKTKPGFTLAAALALALGIGANTAIFSVIITVLARPLPFGEPETLVYLWNTNPALGARQDYFRDDDILALRESATSCAQVTSWLPFNVNVKGVRPERVEGMIVETNFFQTLGAQPLLGHAFTDGADDDGVIIGYDLWQRQFGGAPNLNGQKVNVEGFGARQNILLGVMPPEFDFPPLHTEVWFSYKRAPARTGNHYLRAAARLKRGVTPQQAQSELNTVARASGANFADNRGMGSLSRSVPRISLQERAYRITVAAL